MEHMEQHTWRVRVHHAGRESATAYVRQHQFGLGAPLSFDAQYGQVTALEYLLAALGADLTVGLQTVARQRRLAIDDVEAVVSGELDNPLVYLDVVGEEGHPGLARVFVKLYISTEEPEEAINAAWREVLRRSPLVNTLLPGLALELTLQIVD
jgi:uncharacterized OsmC-like protein